MEDGAINGVGYNAYRYSIYHEVVGVRKVIRDGSLAYIYRKYINDVGFVCPVFVVDVEAEGRRRGAVEAVDEVVEDGIIEESLFGVETINGIVGNVFYIEGQVRRFPGAFLITSRHFVCQFRITADIWYLIIEEIYVAVA